MSVEQQVRDRLRGVLEFAYGSPEERAALIEPVIADPTGMSQQVYASTMLRELGDVCLTLAREIDALKAE